MCQTIAQRKLPAEGDRLILRSRQFSYTDRITTKHVRRNLSWIIAGRKDDEFSGWEMLQQTFIIAVGRDPDEQP